MSKIGSSGHHTTGGFDAADGDHPQADARQARFDDRPKGMGTRDAGLGQRGGTGSHASAGHREDARADAFGRSLDEALSQRKPVTGATARDRQAREPASDAEVSALLAGLSSQPVALAPNDAATPTTEGRHARGTVGGRQAGLKGLWAQEPSAGRAPMASSAASTPDLAHPDRPRAGADAPKRLLHLLAEADPAQALAAQAVAPSPSSGTSAGRADGAAATSTAALPTAAAERVERIADRVAQAIRSEDAVAPGQAVTLEVPLDATGSGGQNLTVSLTATGIDVTLARDAGSASAELLGAAQGLAERLQRRFPNRAVRVYDAVRPSVMAFGQATAARVSPLSDSDDP